MWRRRSRGAREPYSYLHHGTVVRGDLVVEGRLRVHGTVHGDVRVGGLLEVAEDGRVLGRRIEVGDVRILGEVRGEVHATGAVQIWRGGRLDGDVHAATLDIEEGASFSGRSHMPGVSADEADEAATAHEAPPAAEPVRAAAPRGEAKRGEPAAPEAKPRRGGEVRAAEGRSATSDAAADGGAGPP